MRLFFPASVVQDTERMTRMQNAIYGVVSYAVSQRRREIGLRAALGAQQGELQRLFVRHRLSLAGIGVGVGLIAVAGLRR